MSTRSLSAISIAVFLSACRAPASEPTAEHHEDESAAADFTALVQPGDRVILEAPARIVSTAPARGEINVLNRALIARRLATEGDRVKRGQILLEASMPEVSEAIALYRSAGAQLDLAERRFAQLAPLQKEGLLRASELYDLERSIHELRAQRGRSKAVWQAVGLAEAELGAIERAGLIPLRAPVDGIIVRMHAELGHMAEPGAAPLAEVRGEARGRIEASLPTLPPLGALVAFEAIDGRTLTLSSTPAESAIDPLSGRTTVWFTPTADVDVPAGLIGKLQIRPGRARLLEAPSHAVGRDAEGTFVWVEPPNPSAPPSRVRVRVFEDRSGRVVLSADLPVGTKVKIDRGARTEGHAH